MKKGGTGRNGEGKRQRKKMIYSEALRDGAERCAGWSSGPYSCSPMTSPGGSLSPTPTDSTRGRISVISIVAGLGDGPCGSVSLQTAVFLVVEEMGNVARAVCPWFGLLVLES